MPDRMVGGSPELIPNPDPSTITTNAIDRAVSNSTAVMNARVMAINVRLDGFEKAVEVFQSDLTRVPTQLDRAVTSLRDLLTAEINGIKVALTKEIEKLDVASSERFTAVAAQFSERDTRTDQRAGDTKLAVDAAFAAAKEATAKIEASFTKQLDSMISILDTKTSNLAAGNSDLKERVVAIEARTAGITTANLDQRGIALAQHNQNLDNKGMIAIIISIIAVAASLVVHFLK